MVAARVATRVPAGEASRDRRSLSKKVLIRRLLAAGSHAQKSAVCPRSRDTNHLAAVPKMWQEPPSRIL
jgi:hypothetical protein